MKFAEHLSKEQIRMFNQLRGTAKKISNNFSTNKPKINEHLSKRDIEELMGTRRDTYKRVKGAVRRK